MDKSCSWRSWQSTNHSWSPSVAETLAGRKVLLAFKDKWSRDSQRFNNSVWVFWNITYREILGVIKRHSRWIYPHCELISAASVWQQNAVMEDKRTWTLTQSLLFYLPEQTRSIHSDITTLWTSQTVISGTFPLFGNDSRRDFSINFYLFKQKRRSSHQVAMRRWYCSQWERPRQENEDSRRD